MEFSIIYTFFLTDRNVLVLAKYALKVKMR